MDERKAEVGQLIRASLDELGLEWSQTSDTVYSVRLPGTRKLFTDCALEVGGHTMSMRAFVARRPDENHEVVYNWLLQRNMKLIGLSFAQDSLGDIYLVGRIPLADLGEGSIDRLLAVLATTADESFNPILQMGFASSIKNEWEWRLARGESTKNLEAFEHLAPKRPAGDGETSAE